MASDSTVLNEGLSIDVNSSAQSPEHKAQDMDLNVLNVAAAPPSLHSKWKSEAYFIRELHSNFTGLEKGKSQGESRIGT